MEGVMMKNKDQYAIAVRKPNNEIVIEKKTHKDFSEKVKLFKLPIFRGMLAFVDSLVISMKALSFSSSFLEEEEELEEAKKKEKKAEKKNKKKRRSDKKLSDLAAEEMSATDDTKSISETVQKEKKEQEEDSNVLLMIAAVFVSLILSISLFMVLPVLVSNLLAGFITSHFWLSLLEGFIRLTIFIGYILLATRMPEIKRLFMYHGAEHKTINCLENGIELTVENVKWQSKLHKRCGTSFMLLVMLISVAVFIFLPPMELVMKVLSRVLLVPFIAGISYEFIRLAGKSDNKVVNILSKPGLWMQGFTTKEPDDSMIEVAIQSVETVFDWRSFLETAATDEKVVVKGRKTKQKPSPASFEKVSKKRYEKIDGKKQGQMTAAEIRIAGPKDKDEEDDDILRALDKYLDVGDDTQEIIR